MPSAEASLHLLSRSRGWLVALTDLRSGNVIGQEYPNYDAACIAKRGIDRLLVAGWSFAQIRELNTAFTPAEQEVASC